MKEINPVLEGCEGDYVNKLTIDAVEDFNYVRYCWNESLRLQPPAPTTSMNRFSRATNVKGL